MRTYHHWDDESLYEIYKWWKARRAIGDNKTKAHELGVSQEYVGVLVHKARCRFAALDGGITPKRSIDLGPAHKKRVDIVLEGMEYVRLEKLARAHGITTGAYVTGLVKGHLHATRPVTIEKV
jgi:hypothetical protein